MSSQKGFTLIELLIVLALIAILFAILIVIIKPAEIFKRGRDSQRISDLTKLAAATDAFLAEQASNPNLQWPSRGNCSSTIFFSISTTSTPSGWPLLPLGFSATGTTSTLTKGNGWVPINFSAVSILNLSQLPLDPQNDAKTIDGVARAYSFACDDKYNYEFATYPENTTTVGTANDGGNQNNLFEIGPGRSFLYYSSGVEPSPLP